MHRSYPQKKFQVSLETPQAKLTYHPSPWRKKNETKKLPLILFCRVCNEWSKQERRIAAQNNGKSLVKQQGSWGVE